MKLALEEGLITPERSFFDYGCGLGDDVRALNALSIPATGWDPGHRPDAAVEPAGVVNLGYVLNVVPSEGERRMLLRKAWSLAKDVLIISARLTYDQQETNGSKYRDGVVTSKGTFQKFFEQGELRALLQETLGREVLAAGPGVFYVFRSEALRQTCLAKRIRRSAAIPKVRQSDALFEEHRVLLEGMMGFFAERGRLPAAHELPSAPEIADLFGSLPRAFAIVRLVTGREGWDRIQEQRRADLLVYLALARLSQRARFSELAPEMQLDVRELCGTYTRACASADQLLLDSGRLDSVFDLTENLSAGKRTPHALYVHVSGLSALPPTLRVYEGCARHYVGHVEEANVIKLHRHRFQVSYLTYPRFEKDAHPTLASSCVVGLDVLSLRYDDYQKRDNPPILHRKDALIDPTHPLHKRFADLTAQEERRGLLDDTQRIGTRLGWETVLLEKQVVIRGHRLYAMKSDPPASGLPAGMA